ncbi:MAG: metalloregulator ArsR/SmtB family transcription factor [Desulforhopalus sp.]|nr:metalloregulator ArsR/SmtB family transcription factor [Desulforhopalus sp.]
MAGEDAMHDGQSPVSNLANTKCELFDGEFQSVAFLAKSLSDENRLRILLCIRQGKKAVGSIVEELGLSQPLVSHHLKELKRSLLVKIERSGPFIYYELSDPAILGAIRDLNTVAKNLLATRTTF